MDNRTIADLELTRFGARDAQKPHSPKTSAISASPPPGDWFFESHSKRRHLAPLDRLVGQSRTMMRLRARIAKYARTEETVLISGETGTGKELIAKALHDLSSRKNAPFVAVNCAALPAALAERELFGNRRGAYTGAVQNSPGLISRANGGTLFLDEFGELSLHLQSKLLRFLELGTFRPLGENYEHRANARILAATNQNLEKNIAVGEFRADLYYRVNVLQITAPPLREHRADIPQLVGEILGEILPPGSKIQLTESVMAELFDKSWPGNVRQLQNMLRRSLVMSNGELLDRLEIDIPCPVKELIDHPTSCDSVTSLVTALSRHNGNLAAVAHELNVSVRTIQRRLRKHKLQLKDFKAI